MKIKPMSLTAVEELLGWAAAEGWNPGIDDASAFHATDPDGFLMAQDGENSIAGISVVRYGNRQSFLGLYICHPDYRGKGIGISLWNAALCRLDGYTVGLDGVVAQQANYKKSGFELAYRNIRFNGKTSLAEAQPTEPPSAHSATFRLISQSDLKDIFALDTLVHGFDRSALLNHWLLNTENRTTAVCIENSKPVGFGTIRKCLQGHKIGPLIAPSSQLARQLLATLVEQAGAQEITLDVPEPNHAAMELAKTLGLSPSFETARMYRGDAPSYNLDNLYGVTTFELG